MGLLLPHSASARLSSRTSQRMRRSALTFLHGSRMRSFSRSENSLRGSGATAHPGVATESSRNESTMREIQEVIESGGHPSKISAAVKGFFSRGVSLQKRAPHLRSSFEVEKEADYAAFEARKHAVQSTGRPPSDSGFGLKGTWH